MAAIGTGWGSSHGSDGSGGGRGHGWNLLALEALALTEYEEVVVLDQKASHVTYLYFCLLKLYHFCCGWSFYISS